MEYSTKCSIGECQTYIFAKGMCVKHYTRVKRYGDPNIVSKIIGEDRTSKELYGTWKLMHERCETKNHKAYSYYGGRGITVCERWSGHNGLNNFIADMGKRPQGFTLDRKDNSKGYSPENCEWADKSWQQFNQRLSVVSTSGYKGISLFKANGKYQAYIDYKGKRNRLGYFSTLEAAIKARQDAEKELLKNLTKE